jgi:hypothetical protein
MKDTKLILLAVLMVGAVISLTYGVAGLSKARGAAVAKKNAAQKYLTTQQAPAAGVSTRRVARTKFPAWRRSPFAPKALSASPARLTLTGVITDGKRLKAVIGDAIVKPGDKVGPYTVVDIKKTSVTVHDGTAIRELKLER